MKIKHIDLTMHQDAHQNISVIFESRDEAIRALCEKVFGAAPSYPTPEPPQKIVDAQMEIIDAMRKVEAAHFRTNLDTGACSNVMVVWSALRRHLGLPPLGISDLPVWDDNYCRYLRPENSNLLR